MTLDALSISESEDFKDLPFDKLEKLVGMANEQLAAQERQHQLFRDGFAAAVPFIRAAPPEHNNKVLASLVMSGVDEVLQNNTYTKNEYTGGWQWRGKDGGLLMKEGAQPSTISDLLGDTYAKFFAPAAGTPQHQPDYQLPHSVKPAAHSGAALDISKAATKVEATQMISDYLKGKGITTAKHGYNDEVQKLIKANNVFYHSLPLGEATLKTVNGA